MGINVKVVAVTTGQGDFLGRSAEELIVGIARVSSDREEDELFENPDKLLRYMISKGHWSPFEQVMLTFRISQVNIPTSIHLLRHWSMKPQQFSMRYNTIEDMVPVELRNKSKKGNRQSSSSLSDAWLQNVANRSISMSFENYKMLIDNGVAPETARLVLPLSASTDMYYTGSPRSIITLLNERLHEDTQKETREVAVAIRDLFCDYFPITAKALNNFKGAEDVKILDQIAILRNLHNIEKVKLLWA